MENKGQGKVALPPVSHFGIVVRDLEQTIEFYSSVFGIGPFQIFTIDLDGLVRHDRPTSAKMKIATVQTGQIQQVLEGKTPHTEFLRDGMEGLQHIAFIVDDLDEKLAELTKQGINPIFSGNMPHVDFAYCGLRYDRRGDFRANPVQGAR